VTTTDDSVKEALADAYAVVRGAPLDATVKKDGPVVFTYTRFAISETLHGAPSDTITVRQPGAGEDGAQPLVAGEDVILVLDAPGSDKAYPIHDYPSGRYRVQASAKGEVVVVSAEGVDPHFLSPKDKRPRSGEEQMAVDHFRVLAGAPSWEVPSASASAAVPPPPTAPPITNTQATTTTSAPQSDAPAPVKAAGASWWWLGVVIAIAVALVALRMTRRR
jgi:hypothetical protein